MVFTRTDKVLKVVEYVELAIEGLLRHVRCATSERPPGINPKQASSKRDSKPPTATKGAM
jgi:hypothetical protein